MTFQLQSVEHFTEITRPILGEAVSHITGVHCKTGERETIAYIFNRHQFDTNSAFQWVLRNEFSPSAKYSSPHGIDGSLQTYQDGRHIGFPTVLATSDGSLLAYELQLRGEDVVPPRILAQNSDLLLESGVGKTTVFSPAIYDDLPPASLLAAKPASSQPTLTTLVGGIKQYTFDVNNEVFGTSELIHTYKEYEDIDVHLHWVTQGVDEDETSAQYEIEVSVSNVSGQLSASETLPQSLVIPAETPDRTYQVTDFGWIDGSLLTIGAYITFAFRRVANTGTPPTLDPFCLAVGFHAPHDTPGSRARYVK